MISAVGIVDGYNDGSFKPTDVLTRGAAAKIICNLILGPTTASALGADTAPYKDVPASNVFAGYIAYCQKEGIISGYGDGTFKPGNSLTGFAFMKMLLGALGYDMNYEGFTGPNWTVNVAKLASGIDLDDGNKDFVGSKAVTREEACLYAFNTLKATMVEYDSKTTVEISGTTVQVGNEDARDMVNNTNTDGYIDKDGLMQFAEKYHTDLKRSDDTSDDFGRPANEWKFKAETIGTYVDTSLLVGSYTESAEQGQLYQLIGKATVDDIRDRKDAYVETYTNGEAKDYGVDDLFVKSSTADAGDSGRGVLTEVYVDDEYGADEDETMVTIVFINTYLVQATSDYNSTKESLNIDYIDDNGSVRPTGFPNSIDQDDFDVSSYKEDDYLLVTYSLDDKEIHSVAPAKVLTGEVDTYEERDSITVDGTKYKYNDIVGSDSKNPDYGKDETFSVGDSCTLVLDEHGFIMYVDEANASGDYVYIQNTADSSGLGKNAKAAAYFTDGTYKEIDIKKITKNVTGTSGTNYKGGVTSASNIDKDTDALRGWYTYSVNSAGEYTLKDIDANGIKNTKYINTVAEITGAGQIIENEKVSCFVYAGADGKRILANSDTVFLVIDSDDDIDVYTGLTAAPDVYASSKTTKSNPAYVSWVEKTTGKDSGYAKYVLVDMSDDADAKIDDASSDDYLFVLHDSNKRINIGNDKAYFEYDVIVDGEVTTAMINDGDENELEEGKLYNKIKTNSDEYITGGDEIGYDTDEASGTDLKSSTDPIKHSNGTLQLGGKKWIVASDAEIYLAVDGVDANKDLLKDADADFETYLKISANSLAGYLNGYDYTYDYYAVRDDDNSEILTDLYVWVTSAKETNNSGSSTEDTDKGNGYTAETSMASNGRATVRLTANRPSYAAGQVNFSFDVFVGGEYVDTKNGTIESGKDTVTVNWTDSGFDTSDKITIKNFKFDPAAVKVVFEGANIAETTVETNADSFDFTVPSDGYTAGNFNYEITGLSGDKTSGEGTVGQKVTVSNVKVAGDRKVTVTITGLTDEYKITVPESPVEGVTITASVNKAAAGTEVTIYAEAKSFSSGDTYAKAVTVDGKTVVLKDSSKTEVTKITVKGNVDLKAEGAVKVVTTPKLKVKSMSWNNTQIVLKFNLPVDPSSVAKDDFKLTSDTNNATIDGVSVDGDTVILTLQGIPQKGTDKIAMDENKVQSKDHADNTNAAYSEATLN